MFRFFLPRRYSFHRVVCLTVKLAWVFSHSIEAEELLVSNIFCYHLLAYALCMHERYSAIHEALKNSCRCHCAVTDEIMIQTSL